MTPKIDFAIPCDDIRREDNGKFILLGVYGRDIGTTTVPATILLTLALFMSADEPGEWDVEFEGLAGSKKKAEAKGHLAIQSPGPGMFPIPGFLFADLDKPIELRFRWRINGGNWEDVTSIPFVGVRQSA